MVSYISLQVLSLACLVCLFVLVSPAHAYLPILVVRGVFSTAKKYDGLVAMIQQAHPGTQVTVPSCWPGILTAVPIMKQVPCYQKAMEEIGGPLHLVSISQGGIVARTLLETTPNHTVVNWVAYSSPHQGQFGITSFLKPVIPKQYQNTSKEDIYRFFYTSLAQRTISIPNYWKDPNHMPAYLGRDPEYPKLVGSQLLAVINNETVNPMSEQYKANFIKIQSLTLIGGPDDGVITPWWSALFDWVSANGTRIDMTQTDVYIGDSFGLHTLDMLGKIKRYTFSGIKHTEWKDNQMVFDKVVEPMLT